MKVLLVSDTHGKDDLLENIITEEHPDFLCHMGDVEGSADYIREIAGCQLAMVAGNNDYYSGLPQEALFELAGHKIFMTHGHGYILYFGLQELCDAGKKKGADIVLFGHIHQPVVEEIDGITLINPGSLTYPRQVGRRPSYMVMELEENQSPKLEVMYL